MRRIIRSAAIGTVAIAGSLLVAGSAFAQMPCDQMKRYTIYFALHAFPHPFFSVLQRGAEEGARDMCLDLKWTQDTEFSISNTIERMELAVAEQPDFLVIAATDATAMRPTLERAAEAGIPVVASNVPDTAPRAERVPYLLYIGGDEYEGGVEAASKAIADGAPTTRGACLNSFPGHVGLEARCKGWADTFEAAGLSAEQVDVSGGAAAAETALSAYLLANPDVDALFTVSPGPENFEVALDVIRREGLVGKVDLLTFDLTPIILQAIKAGEALGAIDQQPYLQGYLPAVLARQYLDWGLVPGRDILTGPSLVHAGNVDLVIAGTDAGMR